MILLPHNVFKSYDYDEYSWVIIEDITPKGFKIKNVSHPSIPEIELEILFREYDTCLFYPNFTYFFMVKTPSKGGIYEKILVDILDIDGKALPYDVILKFVNGNMRVKELLFSCDFIIEKPIEYLNNLFSRYPDAVIETPNNNLYNNENYKKYFNEE